MTTPTVVPPAGGPRHSEWIVGAVALAMLAVGVALRATHHRASERVVAAGVGLEIPRDWASSVDESSPEVLLARGALSPGTFPSRIALRLRPVAAKGEGPEDLDAYAAQRNTAPEPAESASYTVIGVQRGRAAGEATAVVVDYGYVAPPRAGAPATALPTVVRAQDLVFRLGDSWCVLTFATEAGRFVSERWLWDRALESLSLP